VAALDLSTSERDDHSIVTVRGDLDTTARDQLDGILKAFSGDVVLDLTQLGFIDTSALATIVVHWKRLTGAGGSLALAGAHYRNARVLWITGLAQRLPLYDDVAAAIAGSPA
jgi:anti-sigma B factor antagonist